MFSQSLWDVELRVAERGAVVSYESIRRQFRLPFATLPTAAP